MVSKHWWETEAPNMSQEERDLVSCHSHPSQLQARTNYTAINQLLSSSITNGMVMESQGALPGAGVKVLLAGDGDTALKSGI